MQHRLVVASRAQLRAALPAVMLAGTAWLVLIGAFATGSGAVVRHDRLLQDGPPLWLATILFVAGWQVMVLAMMVPASVHAFARVGLSSSTFAFAVGYIAAWTAFGLLIFYLDAGVHAIVDHWSWLAARPWLIAGTTLVVAGTYQLSGLKANALVACRQLSHVSDDNDPLAGGFIHGLRCIGAGWGLMLIAFALGAGSLFAMAALTLLMIWEVTPWAGSAVKPAGYALVALGVVVLAGPIQAPPWWPL